MGFNLHAEGTNDPQEVRNWKIHLYAIIASMSAIASMTPLHTLMLAFNIRKLTTTQQISWL
jgi:hypothetical protein